MEEFDLKRELKIMNILYVEDEEMTRSIFERSLKRMFKNVFTAENGAEGVKLFKENEIDLILTDINMPVMDGLEMAEEIKGLNSTVPIIISSAYNDSHYLMNAIDIGIEYYITKPVDMYKFREKLKKIALFNFNKKSFEEAHKNLKAEKEILSTVLNSQSSIVLLFSEENKASFINKQFFDIFDFKDLDDFRSKYDNINELFIPENSTVCPMAKENPKWFLKCLEMNKKQKVSLIDKHGNNRIFYMTLVKLPEHDDADYSVTLVDITQLQEALQKAERSNEAKSNFLANMSHEIRTPMNGILGFANILLGTKIDQKQKEFLNIILKSTNGLLEIINGILDFSKIESGKFDIESIPFTPFEEIEPTIGLFSAKAQEKNISILPFIDPLIPQEIIGDPLRIKQILINLIGNAIKFTDKKGSIKIEINKISENRENKTVKLMFAVQDTGIGIPLDKQKKIFDPFSQADDSTSRKYGGTGLGLSITKRLLNLMGSELQLESKENIGSKFFFEIEFKIQDESNIEKINNLEKRTVLIYSTGDSEITECENLMSRYLKSLNVEYFKFSNLQEFVKYKEINFIITHTNLMPKAILELFKKRQIPVIFATEKNTIPSESDKKIFSKIINHPVNSNELLEIINKLSDTISIDDVEINEEDQEKTETKSSAENNEAKEVLVVEDNEVNQQLIIFMLEMVGLKVTVASDGREGVNTFTNNINKFDLILMDINMPILSGLEATEEIINYEKNHSISHTPIVALTANAIKGDRERFLSSGMDDYLSKPIDKGELDNILAKYLNVK